VHVSQCCDWPTDASVAEMPSCHRRCCKSYRAACALYRSCEVTDMRELGSVASLSAMWLCTQPPCPSSWSIEADSSASSWSSLQGYEAVQAGESASSKDTQQQLQQPPTVKPSATSAILFFKTVGQSLECPTKSCEAGGRGPPAQEQLLC
jgi:hypothetical protein